MPNAIFELVVFLACHDRSCGFFIVDFEWRHLHRTDVVCFELRYVVGLALDAGHDVMCGVVGLMLRCVAMVVDGIVVCEGRCS